MSTEILSWLGEGYRRVILIVMDALSLHRLQRWMADDTAPVWGELARDELNATLTSIVPSTTSSALTSLHAPITFKNDSGSLKLAGFSPEGYLPFPTLGAHLAANGVQTYAFQHQSILNSGLSRMIFKDVKTQAFFTASDLWVNLRQVIESHPGGRQYIYVYWSELDTLSHRYGPDDERSVNEFASFSLAFERLFLHRLSPLARQDTLLILIADHGQITTHPDPRNELRNHPRLTSLLHLLPTCENRLAFLYVRPGQEEEVGEYIKHTWPGQFTLINPAHAVNTGLFGPGVAHPRLLERLGDCIAVAHDDAYWWWADKENFQRGRHGGLHPDEMLVPFLAARL